jgi:hypothetical protein
VSANFLLLWQNTWKKQLKGEMIYFGSWFQRFHFMISCSNAVDLQWNRTSRQQEQVTEEAARKQKERRRDQRQGIS